MGSKPCRLASRNHEPLPSFARRIARLLVAAAEYGLGWASQPESPQLRSARHRLPALLQEGRPNRRAQVEAAERMAGVKSDNAPYLEVEAYRTDLRSHLGRIRCPVLVACGSQDAVFWAALKLYRRYLPAATVVTFPGVGHHPAIEEPEAFLSAVIAFLRDSWCEAKVFR